MKKINIVKYKRLLILIIVVIVLMILLISYIKIIKKYRNERIFALTSEKYAEEVIHPIFKIDKIMIYSDANVEDLSESKNLSDINVSQFTDFAIYINNAAKSEELSEANTINKIYIDNIGITVSSEETGTKKFASKRIDDIGKYVPVKESSREIKYRVIHKNADKKLEQNTKNFFTDCSEPIVLSYVNENIVKNIDVSKSGEKLSLDGSMLRYLNINLEDLNYKINFKVNIENNLGEKFYCNCSLNIDLSSGSGEGIYSGYIMQIFDLSNSDYRFKKV